MATPDSKARLVRFGPFELDGRAGELRKHGIKIKIREQPVRILVMLLDHPGEVVLREEIRLRLWPNNTIVEFDHGINAAVQKLRDALGDSASEPRYVETVARRGYRFLGAVEKSADPVIDPDDSQLEGKTISHYRILQKLGEGGMGVVWRAQDPRLNREVAIKMAGERFSDRFEREARVIAALNHPNICTLYDVGPNYLVMELIEGESPKGPLALEQALRIARQIADALDAAHEKGIVHRDLKPGNIKIKPDGSVKVLDFGLAKTIDTSSGDPESSPTMTVAPTRAGMIMGTAAYMSPEQASGKTVDKRADIWAFGVVLYEMLTGRRPFQGNDLTEVLASVIKDEPNLDLAPARVQRLLRSCLEKDQKRRLQAIGDWRLLLEEPTPRLTAPLLSRLGWASAGVAALAVVAGLAMWAPWRPRETFDHPLVRLDVELGPDVSLPTGLGRTGSDVAISPDGTQLAYASGTPPKLFIRRLDQAKATELPGTQGGRMPFFSPDGRWIGFASRKLNKISVEGGPAIPLTGNLTGEQGADWVGDGSMLAGDLGRGLFRILAAGPIQEVAELGRGETAFMEPQLLPGGKKILFSNYASIIDHNTIEVLTLANGHRKVVVRAAMSPRYLPTSSGAGYLIYLRKTTLFAVAFDPASMETRGTPVPVLDDVEHGTMNGGGQFAFTQAPSGHGTLVYRSGIGAPDRFVTTLEYVDPMGKRSPLRAKAGAYRWPRISPDGNQIAVSFRDGDNWDIWVYDARRDTMMRLTFGDGYYYAPVWTPDGRHVIFASSSAGFGIFQARADGTGQPQILIKGKHVANAFSPDGKRLLYSDLETATSQIWTVPVEEQGGKLITGKPEQFLKTSFVDSFPSISPDGHWVAYRSNSSGKEEDYVRPFSSAPSGQGGRWQISANGGGHFLRWSRNGHELFYESGRQIMVVSYTAKGDTFVAGKPRLWLGKFGDVYWDLAPDGKRILVAAPVDFPPEHQVVMLQNFLDELRRRAPLTK